MARQERSRQPKKKFVGKGRCAICKAEKGLIQTIRGLRYACTQNPSHTPLK